jgi:hypothetical protein
MGRLILRLLGRRWCEWMELWLGFGWDREEGEMERVWLVFFIGCLCLCWCLCLLGICRR